MRILLLVDSYYPSPKAAAKLIHDLGIEFLKQGHDVIVATPSDSNTADLELSIEEGLLIARIKSPKLKVSSRLARGFREARLAPIMWRKGAKFFHDRPCDLIVFYSPTIFWGPLVRKLKSLWGCPAYLILRDIFPQWAVDAGVLRTGVLYRYLRRRELEQYVLADVIGVQSDSNLKFFAEQFPNNSFELEVLYNWTSLDDGRLPFGDYRNRLGLQGKIIFVYGGTMGVAQDIENIVRLGGGLTGHRHIQFVLVGDGSETSRIGQLITAGKLANIRMLPSVGQKEYLALLSECDVGLISLDRRLKTQNFPGKMLGYMYCSLPILASINPGNDLGSILEKSGSGLWCSNGDDESFRAHALALANDPDLRKRMGQNARSLLEQRFSVACAAKQILTRFIHEAPERERRWRCPQGRDAAGAGARRDETGPARSEFQ